MKAATRRTFLANAAGAAGLLLLPRCGTQPQIGGELAGDVGVSPPRLDGGVNAGSTSAGADAGVFDGGLVDGGVTPQCIETDENILGPFYRTNAPVRQMLAPPNAADPLIITGAVRGVGATCRALPGALLDVWQADEAGAYDNQSPEFRFRGRLTAAADGTYEFQSALPGRYLNGGTYRPRHIHLIVTHPGFVSLTTQLYFEGDPFLGSDPFVVSSLVIPLSQNGDGVWRGTFDITLGNA